MQPGEVRNSSASVALLHSPTRELSLLEHTSLASRGNGETQKVSICVLMCVLGGGGSVINYCMKDVYNWGNKASRS